MTREEAYQQLYKVYRYTQQGGLTMVRLSNIIAIAVGAAMIFVIACFPAICGAALAVHTHDPDCLAIGIAVNFIWFLSLAVSSL